MASFPLDHTEVPYLDSGSPTPPSDHVLTHVDISDQGQMCIKELYSFL